METIEIILDNYSQKTKNEALVAALKSDNATLVELVLKLKPDLLAGGAELFKYAIRNCNFELLGELLWEPEIGDNQELLNEGIRIAVSLERTEWSEVLCTLIQDGGDANVAVEELLKQEHPSIDVIIALLKLGAKAHFWPMHLDRHQLIAEKLIKEGFGKSVKFSDVALEQFCLTICQNSRQGVVKKLIKDRPDLLPTLTEIAVKGGYTATVKLLHQENAITSIDDKLFEKAISGKHYHTVKYLAQNGIRQLKHKDVVNAAAFGTVNMMLFLISAIESQGNALTPSKFAIVIEVACAFNRVDSVKALFYAGHKCDFDANITLAANHGYRKMVDVLMQYATKLNESSFDKAAGKALANGHSYLAFRMRDHKRKNPQKFQ